MAQDMQSVLCTWEIAPCDDLFPNGLLVDSNVNLIVATESCREGDLDSAVSSGRSWLNDVGNGSGAGAFVNHTTPKTV